MLKLIVIFLTIILIGVNCTILGSYADRPELKQDRIIQGLVKYTSEHLATTKNLLLDNIKITRVQTQVVAGINYKIDFTGDSIKSGKSVTCQAALFVQPDLSVKINQAQCNKT